MEITFDPAKDASNRHKHGVSLADAARIDLDSVRYWVDERIDHSETRYRGQGLIGDRLYSVAFTIRDGVMRVISLRKANAREVRDHAQHD